MFDSVWLYRIQCKYTQNHPYILLCIWYFSCVSQFIMKMEFCQIQPKHDCNFTDKLSHDPFCKFVLNWNFLSSFYIKHTEIKIRSLWCVPPSSNQLGHVLGEPYCVPNYTIPVIGVRNGMACSLPWWYKYLHAVTAMTYTSSTYMPVLFPVCWFGACNFKREKLFVMICYLFPGNIAWFHLHKYMC